VRGVAIDEWGGRERMRLRDDLPRPPVAPDGVLVRVRAAGLNPVDWKMREGRLAQTFPFHFPLVLGWDAAGVVEAVGPSVTWFKPGDEVYGYCRRHDLQLGTYAEYTTVPEGFLAHKPRELSFEEAAALPLALLSAHQALEIVGLRGGETLLVSGGSGGVGHLAVQLGVARGARVFATTSRRNAEFVHRLGAEPIDYTAGDVAARVHERLAGHDGVDTALDLFGGEGREELFGVLRRGGRLVSLAGPPPEPREGYEVHYHFVRPSGYDLGELNQLVQEGKLRPHLEAVLPLAQAAEAHERLESGRVRGKLVLTV